MEAPVGGRKGRASSEINRFSVQEIIRKRQSDFSTANELQRLVAKLDAFDSKQQQHCRTLGGEGGYNNSQGRQQYPKGTAIPPPSQAKEEKRLFTTLARR